MKNDYIVTTCKNTDQDKFVKLLEKHKIDININYNGLKRCYYISMMASKVPALLAEPEVLHIAPAHVEVKLMETQKIAVNRNGFGDNWGLARICKRNEWDDNTWYPFSDEYVYYKTGEGVDVYVVDTGCRLTHTDLRGRVLVVYDHFRHPGHPQYGMDEQGHGTHVASTIAGVKHGVAKRAHVKVARVFQTGGTTLSAIVQGIDACLQDHREKINQGIDRPSIMNLSLGGPPHRTEEQIINDCIEEGIVIVAAAGNSGRDLGEMGFDVMPAEIERAITVGAVDIQDKQATFSNYGAVVDVFAPGVYITAAHFQNDNDELMLSGTSMAAPHVAGVCALYLESHKTLEEAADVKIVHDWIRKVSSKGTLHLTENANDVKTANRFLFSSFVDAPESEPVPEPPVPEPIFEVNRTEEEVVETNISRNSPTVETTFEDRTETIINDNGSVTTRVIRRYTDTETTMVTTTVTTIIVSTITYSDGSVQTVYSDPQETTSTEEEIRITHREETISEETGPVPEPDPMPEPDPAPGNKWGWWKDSSTWHEGRGRNFRQKRAIYFQCLKVNRIYERFFRTNRDTEIENILAQLELAASNLINSNKWNKVDNYYVFRAILVQAIQSMRIARRS